MANENLKIKIQEVNNTIARGAGASSDVAYIPGLAIKEAKSKNTPKLCSTISDFEAEFGATPYVMQPLDVNSTGIEYLNYKEGDYDKSYLYAKELINAGMSVVYENICNESTTQQVASVNFIKVADKGQNSSVIEAKGNNTFTYSAADSTSQIRTFKFNLPKGVTAATVHVVPEASEHFTATINELAADQEHSGQTYKDKITITKTKHSGVISLNGVEVSDMPYITYTLKVSLTNTKEQSGADFRDPCSFQIYVLEGKDVSLVDEVESGSKIVYLYNHLADAFKKMLDKNEYSIKYLTSGGYPTFIDYNGNDYALANTMLSVAGERGDAVALIDPADNENDPLAVEDEGSTYHIANTKLAGANNAEYGAMFMPWGDFACATTGTTAIMPPSFAYLMCMATAIKTSPNWLAMAGVTRGLVPNLRSLHTNKLMSNMIAENYQPRYGSNNNKISVNAITNVKPYGLAIWGNRTLENVGEKGTTAHNFLNTRNMISDIKKVAYSTAKLLMFEQDSDTLWLNFKTQMSPLLDQLKSGNGISDYKIIRGTTKYNGKQLDRGELAAVIKIYPRYAIEYFEITVAIEDEEVSVS